MNKESNTMSLDTIMTMDEVCEFLRVHKSTVYRMLKQKCFPVFKIGSDWRFSRVRLDEWRLRQQEEGK